MWIRDNSKTKERLEEYKKIYIQYNKILATIRSSININHINCCIRVVDNFEDYCLKSNLQQNTRIVLVRNLKEYIKLKKKSIWNT